MNLKLNPWINGFFATAPAWAVVLSASAARLLDLIKLLLDLISGEILFRNPGSEKLRRASLHPDCSRLPPGDVAQFTPLPTTTSQAPGARALHRLPGPGGGHGALLPAGLR